MKTIFTTIFLHFFCFAVNAQAPTWQWAESNSSYGGVSIAADADGNLYITGHYYGAEAVFGGITITQPNLGYCAIFIVKYDACGDVQWAKSIGGTSYDFGNGIATDRTGNIYVTGSFRSPSVSFDSITLSRGTDSSDMYIVKYNASGNVLWAKNAGGYGNASGQAITTDANSNIIVTGYFSSSAITFGGVTLSNNSSGSGDIFITRYDTSGNVEWAKKSGGGYYDEGTAITTDSKGNIFITGVFESDTLKFDSIALQIIDTGTEEVFIAKYDSSGNALWAQQGGGNAYTVGSSIAADKNGNVIVTGSFYSFLKLAGIILAGSPGTYVNSDFFIAKFDSSGNLLWAKSAGGSETDYGAGVVTDSIGNILVIGAFSSPTITFGSIALANNGPLGFYDCVPDLFITKYDSSGNVLWAERAGGPDNNSGSGITIDNMGNVSVIGQYACADIILGANNLTDSNGCNAFIANFGIPNTDHCVTGIPIPRTIHDLDIFPNPTTSQLTITSTQNITNITITNLLGQTMYDRPCNASKVSADVSSFPGGIYFVKVQFVPIAIGINCDNNSEIRRFVKE